MPKQMLKRPFIIIVKSVLLFLGVIAYLICRLLRPLVKVRIGLLAYDRIGHLSLNTEVYLRREASDKSKGRKLDFFICGRDVVNEQLTKMIARRLTVLRGYWAVFMYGMVRSIFKESDLWLDLPSTERAYFEVG